MMFSRKILGTALVLTFLASGSAVAQVALPNMAAVGGQMHAMAEACGGYTAAQLQDMKQQQKTASAAAGLAPAAFDEAFEKAYDSTRAKLATMGKAEKAKTCLQLKATSGQN